MAEPVEVVIFCEDVAQECFAEALVRRLAREVGCSVHLRSVSARGGHGMALAELRAFQTTGQAGLLVVVIDGNCEGWHRKREQIASAIDTQRCAASAIGCPDPHIERWYLADPTGIHTSLGAKVTREKAKCERDRYKRVLTEAIKDAGHTVTLGGAEFAQEIVDGMDLYKAGKNEPSLGSLIDELRAAIKRLGKEQ
jgi:hypothetical protein